MGRSLRARIIGSALEMRTIFVKTKRELGKAYEVADPVVQSID